MLRILLVSLTILTLAGCTGLPKAPPMNFHEGGRIGLYIDVSEIVKHKHVGTTIFNNNEKVYPVQWDLAKNIQQIVSSKLTQKGYEVIIIPSGSLKVNPDIRLIEHKGDSWTINPSEKSLYDRLRNDMKLDAVFIFQKGNTMVNLECGAGGCSPHYMDAPGLFSRSMFGLAYYKGSWGFDWYTYSLNPPADLTKTDPFEFHFRETSAWLNIDPEFVEPTNISALTPEELNHLKMLIFKDIENKTQMLIDNMNL